MANQHESGTGVDGDQESVSLRGCGLTTTPSSLFSMETVRSLDLSSNELTRFPGARVGQEMPHLEVLVLSNNLLHVLEDIMALASAPRLCELDVRDNPLRLRHNRLYLLETLLFEEAGLDEEILRELHRDDAFKCFTRASQPPRNASYRARLPRRCGFPMLQVLNGDWILDSETRQVELERGEALEYYRSPRRGNKKGIAGAQRSGRKASGREGMKVNERRFDGSRMTVKQMLRNEARITAVPLPRVLKHYQIDTESYEEVNVASGSDAEDDDHELILQLFRPLASLSLAADSSEPEPPAPPDVKRATGSSESEPWNYPISTFDDLQSDERQYVRYKSKFVGGTLERDDHYFESSTFLDCVAQSERSRRLTIRAVDLLTQPQAGATELPPTHPSSRTISSIQSAPTLPISEAAASLTDNLSANFTKSQARESFDRVVDFQRKQLTVGGCQIQAAVGDYLLGEHVALRQKTNQLLSGQAASEIRWRDNAHGIEASLEESLSKVKLRNAVDLANALGGGREQKRLIQALIDADAKVIEEERVTAEHKSHRQRLRRINARKVALPQTRRDVDLAKKLAMLHEESPWQERNWKAKMKLYERKREEDELVEPPSAHARPLSRRGKRMPQSRVETHSASAPASVSETAKFRTVETVEKAALDPLVQVNSHDLLVRCSEIRQNKEKHVKALAMHRDRFLDDEAEWEHMRQDPINVVRRHLRRKLYQDVQQIQIGSMEYFYSPLFQ